LLRLAALLLGALVFALLLQAALQAWWKHIEGETLPRAWVSAPQAMVASPAAGTVAKLLVAEGTYIGPGQTLAVLAPLPKPPEEAGATTQPQQQQWRLARARQAAEKARLAWQLSLAQTQSNRLQRVWLEAQWAHHQTAAEKEHAEVKKQLWRAKAAGPAEEATLPELRKKLEASQMALDAVARNHLRMAALRQEEQAGQLNASLRQAEWKQAQQELLQETEKMAALTAQTAAAASGKALAPLRVTSPEAGQVAQVYVQPGMSVSAGQRLLAYVLPQRFVEATLPVQHAQRLAPGMPATVLLWHHGRRAQLTARIQALWPDADPAGASYRVKLAVSDAQHARALKDTLPGTPVQVRIKP
jgi:multidrug resistance efflux pump